MKIPKPKAFKGAYAKELENFLFDLEQYFQLANTDSEDTKVSIASMYLLSDTKLWWHTKRCETASSEYKVNSYVDFKQELKLQF